MRANSQHNVLEVAISGQMTFQSKNEIEWSNVYDIGKYGTLQGVELRSLSQNFM